ncbi:MAG: FAD-dependent oxidoreductase [Pseudomonadota bacterium]
MTGVRGQLDRRVFMGGAAASLAGPPLARPAFAATGDPARPFDAPYAPVQVSPDRVIRSVVGLRPYRAAGFVLKRENVARRTLIHNYGHGGCGVTLSWGCARMAVELAAETGERRAAIIGSGVMGLTTAAVLAQRGYDVTLYAEDFPPNTTSNIAGALWFPTSLYDPDVAGDAFLAQFRQAARLAHRDFQHLANRPGYGVWWLRFLELHDAAPATPLAPAIEGNDLYPGRAASLDPEANLGFPYAVRFHALMIDPDHFLPALMADIRRAGGRFVQRRFETPGAVYDLKEKLIFNCSGYGAKALFGDDAMTPISGQLTLLLPQTDIDYGYVNPSEDGLAYMFPRRGAIVLGGTTNKGDASLAVNDAEKQRMLARHAAIAASAR